MSGRAMHNRSLHRAQLFVLALSALACHAQDEGCRALMGRTTVHYQGDAVGEGEITLRSTGVRRVEGRLALRGKGELDLTRLEAYGTCRDGVVRLRLAGVDEPSAPARVLGGRVLLVHDDELLGEDFGTWRARIAPKDGGAEQEVQGQLSRRPKTPPIVAR